MRYYCQLFYSKRLFNRFRIRHEMKILPITHYTDFVATKQTLCSAHPFVPLFLWSLEKMRSRLIYALGILNIQELEKVLLKNDFCVVLRMNLCGFAGQHHHPRIQAAS